MESLYIYVYMRKYRINFQRHNREVKHLNFLCISSIYSFKRLHIYPLSPQRTGGKQKARGPNLALHLVLSRRAPCFYPEAVPSSLPLVKEQLHLYSPNITFVPLNASSKLMWPPMKMSLTPLVQIVPHMYLLLTYVCPCCHQHYFILHQKFRSCFSEFTITISLKNQNKFILVVSLPKLL